MYMQNDLISKWLPGLVSSTTLKSRQPVTTETNTHKTYNVHKHLQLMLEQMLKNLARTRQFSPSLSYIERKGKKREQNCLTSPVNTVHIMEY